MELLVNNYFSNIEKSILLHQSIHIVDNKKKGRENISPPEQSLQASFLTLEKNQTFQPHKHITFKREMPIAQESWIVIEGRVEVTYFDLDDSILKKVIINKGECTITYRGGHNYLSLEDNTNVYEMKTGPYFGQKFDKEFINQ